MKNKKRKYNETKNEKIQKLPNEILAHIFLFDKKI